MNYLPTDADERAQFPMFDGLMGYFPAALAWVSRCSKVGNDQHNPGEPLHWAMDKSTDHKNKIVKHLLDVGTDDTDDVPHSVKVAWRALALAQEDLMARKGAPAPHNGRKAPKEHRRVATPAELAAYGVNALPSNLASAITTKDSPLKHVELQAQDTAPKFPPYGPYNWPQAGHRVRVTTVDASDRAHGVHVGMTGLVAETDDVPYVDLDSGFRRPLIADLQLERIG